MNIPLGTIRVCHRAREFKSEESARTDFKMPTAATADKMQYTPPKSIFMKYICIFLFACLVVVECGLAYLNG